MISLLVILVLLVAQVYVSCAVGWRICYVSKALAWSIVFCGNLHNLQVNARSVHQMLKVEDLSPCGWTAEQPNTVESCLKASNKMLKP